MRLEGKDWIAAKWGGHLLGRNGFGSRGWPSELFVGDLRDGVCRLWSTNTDTDTDTDGLGLLVQVGQADLGR